MPQMMPLQWILNLLYTTLMLNLYIITTHYLNLYSPPALKSSLNKSLKIKINLLW